MNKNKKKMLNLIFTFLFLYLCFFLISVSFGSESPKDVNVVALVNDAPINRFALVIEVNKLVPMESYHRNLNPEKMKEIEKKALESLIDKELLYQEAKKQGIKPDKKEIKRIYDATKSSYKTKKAFDAALVNNGLTTDTFKLMIEKQIVVEKFMEKDMNVSYSDQDLEDYYKKNIDKFREPEAVRVRHIYVTIDPTDPEGKKKAKEKADEAYSKIKAGSDFAEIAYNYSSDPSRVKGGDVGFLHRDMMPSEFEALAFSLGTGQVSEIIETELGYHILKLEEKRPARTVPFTDTKEKLRKELKESSEKKKMEELKKRLRGDARINYLQ